MRFLSLEPLLEPIDCGTLAGIDWVIVGGESGARDKVRPCAIEWIADIVRQCQAANVPVFVKQLGTNPICAGGVLITVDKKGADPSEWPAPMTCRRQIDNRQRCYTLLAIAKKQLCLDEETYRAFPAKHGARMKGGRISATTMSIGQLMQAVEAMKKHGFKPTCRASTGSAAYEQTWRARMEGKIARLWFLGYEHGVIRDSSKAAMERWCCKAGGLVTMRWFEAEHYNRCIEGLKSWLAREGVSVDR